MSQKKKLNNAWGSFRFGRPSGGRGKPKKRILIVCEGEKTEPNYFRSFRVTSASVVVKGIGKNTSDLINAAIELKNCAERKYEPYDEVWCVFDRDSFDSDDFVNAFRTAKEEAIKIAYSNEAFEIWYLLHFDYFQSALRRDSYEQRLTRYLGKTYKKNSTAMYEYLLDKQKHAIRNAKKLLLCYPNPNPERDNPSTTVFQLVEELNRNMR